MFFEAYEENCSTVLVIFRMALKTVSLGEVTAYEV